MPKRIPTEQKILKLERENVMLRQRVLRLERKIDKMKIEYEKKLKVKSQILISEEDRQRLIAQREKILREAAKRPSTESPHGDSVA
jgi:hypothetical protein